MKIMRTALVVAIPLFLCGQGMASAAGDAAQAPPAQTPSPAAPESGPGAEPRSSKLTAEQQGESRADIETTRKIRRAILGHKGLSTSAHNVTIITRNGHVTLKGAVRSEDERRVINIKANRIAGAGNVTDEIEVVEK